MTAKETVVISEELCASWLDKVTSWNDGLLPNDVASTESNLDALEPFLAKLRDVLAESSSTIARAFPSVFKLLSRLAQNVCVQASPIYELVLTSIDACRSKNAEKSELDKQADTWARKMLKKGSTSTGDARKSNALETSLKNQLESLSTRTWCPDLEVCIPEVNFSGTCLRDLGKMSVVLDGLKEGVTRAASSACDVVSIDDDRWIVEPSLNHSIASKLVKSDVSESRLILWRFHKRLYDDEVLRVIGKFVESDPLECEDFSQFISKGFIQSGIPYACVQYPDIFLHTDQIFDRFLYESNFHLKAIRIVSNFSTIFVDFVRNSKDDPPPVLTHYYPRKYFQLVTLLCFDPKDVANIDCHLKRISQHLDALSPVENRLLLAKNFRWIEVSLSRFLCNSSSSSSLRIINSYLLGFDGDELSTRLLFSFLREHAINDCIPPPPTSRLLHLLTLVLSSPHFWALPITEDSLLSLLRFFLHDNVDSASELVIVALENLPRGLVTLNNSPLVSEVIRRLLQSTAENESKKFPIRLKEIISKCSPY